MTNIKEVIEIALNDGYTVKRFKVESVEIGTVIKVNYYDSLLTVLDSCEFSL